jgi:hypothetical protein
MALTPDFMGHSKAEVNLRQKYKLHILNNREKIAKTKTNL